MCQSCEVTLAATLFDMDGLLIDSEILWHKAEGEIFGGLGVPIDERTDRSTKGMYVNQVVDYWYGRFPWRDHRKMTSSSTSSNASAISSRVKG